MKRRAISLGVLFFWLASAFQSAAAPPAVAAFADQDLRASVASARGDLWGPTAASRLASSQARANAGAPSPDKDYDGLTDAVEGQGWRNSAGVFITDPLDPDSDDDGLTDGQEQLFDTDPLNDTSPGIYVIYNNDLKSSKYFPWERHGSQFIAFDSAVVRRGATFYVGGPADATISIGESGSLTNLAVQRDACTAQWRVTVPNGGTVGKYTITLQRGTWSQSMNLYVIFELPSGMSDADVAAYVYSDDPDNFRDEYAIWFMTSNDAAYSWPPWPPYHQTRGRGMAFQTDYYQAYVFEDHVIDAINGYTSPWSAAEALGHHLDGLLWFESSSLRFNMWSALHSFNQQAQCSTHASAMTSFARAAGIPARPVVVDWDMFRVPNVLFDHSTEVWLSNNWRVMRAYRADESPDGPINGGIHPPRDRQSWFYRDSYGDIVVVADSDWVWEQMQTDWTGSNHMDYLFANYDNRRIVRWDWVDTETIPYNFGWGMEPYDIGDPFQTWLTWPSSPPTPAVIVTIVGGGTVTKTPDQPSYDYGDVVTLRAYPNPGWSFADWSGDVSSTSNPRSITITEEEDVNVTATFTPHEYTLTINISGNGSVTRDPNQSTYHYGDVVTLEAVPQPSWSFEGWSGAVSGTDNPVDLTITGNTSVTATFIHGSTSAPSTAEATFSNDNAGASAASSQSSVVQLGQVVADYGVDLDGDGRFDQLVIEVEVYASQPGYYTVGGLLDSPNFTAYAKIPALASARAHAYLETGPQTVPLVFDGRSIALTRVDGPYTVKSLWISDLNPQADLPELTMSALDRQDPAYTTAPYRASEFETLGATLADQYSERGMDSNRNGRYESLRVDVGFEISTPGTYTLVGELYDARGRSISQATWTGTSSPASLQFDEVKGTVGPYTLKNLYLLNANDEIIDSRPQAYTTQGVTIAEGRTHIVGQEDLGQLSAIMPGGYTDSGVDLDGDARYDLLRIDVPVEVDEAGQYRLEGWLEKDEALISWAIGQLTTLTTGTHTLSLSFSGPAINAHNTAGPFTLMALKLIQGSGYQVLDEVDVAYTTGAYTPEQFESLPYLQLSADQVLLFEDHLENGAGNWTANAPWALITAQSHSPTHAWTDSPDGNYDNNVGVSLATTPISPGAFSRPTLQFQTCYDLESDFDHGYIDVSTDGGATWSNVASYTGTTTHWTGEVVDLGWVIAAQTLRVRFRLVTDAAVPADGWYIDDVVIYHDTDMDDDGIPNDVEVGNDPGDPVDSDGDGTPDYLDDDSDDDGIPDAVEAGDDPEDPVDSDGDGTPDFQDEDSDNDGIPDAIEAGDDPEDPPDTDGDGTPDYQDEDSDNDGIPDSEEGNTDSDGDGTPDYQDEDSDNDGMPDAVDPNPTRFDFFTFLPLVYK